MKGIDLSTMPMGGFVFPKKKENEKEAEDARRSDETIEDKDM